MFSLFSWGRLQFKSSSSNTSGFSGCSSGPISDSRSVSSSDSDSSSTSLSSKSLFRSKSGFTLTELIVVITILSILSVIGFVVMSHQSSVARDGKRISDIKTLSESARITSAQLRLLPTPIADSIALSVSGTFIGYQGFMSTALVNPLGYGSDKIFDPKDNIPYTYRVNQYYDSAQFMAYLENPRFERTIEIAGIMNGGLFDGKKMQEIASQSLYSTLSSSLSSTPPFPLPSLFPQAYALDSSTIDLASRYPYAVGDMLGVFITKDTNQPLQSGVTGTGSRDISLSDSGTLDIIVGSEGADGYVSTDISTGSLLSLKDGSFDEKALLGMNSGTGSGSGSGGGDSGGGGGGPVSHILTMGEYSIMGETYYGYIGPQTISLYATYGVTITTVTPGSLIDDTVDGYVIDTIILDSSYSSPSVILAGNTDMPSGVAFETPYANINCISPSVLGDITSYSCIGSTVSTDFYVGSQHDLGINIGNDTCDLTSGEVLELNILMNQSKTDIDWCQVGSIDLSNKSLASIPSGILKMKYLQSLWMPNNNIASIPADIAQLTELSALNISYNQITEFPAIILTGVTSLNTLIMDGNQVTSIPSGIEVLTNLGYLSLAGNQITELPASITNLQTLTYLSVGGNELTSLPSNLGNLNQLTSLYIFGNQLTLLPDSIGNITTLETLYFSNNQITSIPSTFSNLTNLRYLNIGNNNLSALPEFFANYTQLIGLYASNNNISSLPSGIGNLVLLQSLNLSANQLSTLPASIVNLHALGMLELQVNSGLGALSEQFNNGYNRTASQSGIPTINDTMNITSSGGIITISIE